MRKFFLFYVLMHFHVALAAASLYLLYGKLVHVPASREYLIFLFTSTVFYYTFLRLIHLDQLRPLLKNWYRENVITSWFALIISGFISGIVFLFYLPDRIKLNLIPFLILAIMYHINPPKRLIISLRNIGKIKIFIISSVWAGVIVGVPLDIFQNFHPKNLLIFIHAFMFVLIWTIPFDIRDLTLDSTSLATIPQMFRNKTKTLILSLIIVFLVLNFLLMLKFQSDFFCGMLLLLSMPLLYFSACESKKREDYFFTAFWVEGLPVWLLVFCETIYFIFPGL